MIPFPILSNTNIARIVKIKDLQSSIGGSCAVLSTDNKLLMRGSNTDYQFGIPGNQTNNYTSWTYVRGDVDRIFVGSVCTIAITVDGKILCTGQRKGMGVYDGTTYYQGFGDLSWLFAASGITSDMIKDIKIGQWSTLILLTDGRMFGVGDNGWGELGQDGTVTTMKLIASGVDAIYLSTATSFYFKRGVGLYSSGRNSSGQAGRGGTASSISSFGLCTTTNMGSLDRNLTSINETGSGTGIVLTDDLGNSTAYTCGTGMGAADRNAFNSLSTAYNVSSNAFFDSGSPFTMNLMRTNTALQGTGNGSEFGLDSGAYTQWTAADFPAPNSSLITKMVSLRSYGSYILYNNELWAVQNNATWFGTKETGWIKQQFPYVDE